MMNRNTMTSTTNSSRLLTLLLISLLCQKAQGTFLRSLSQFASTFENEGQQEGGEALSFYSPQQVQASVVATTTTDTTNTTTPLPRDLYIDKATGLAYMKVPGGKAKGKTSAELYAFVAHGHGNNNKRQLGAEDVQEEEQEQLRLRHLKGTTDTIPPSITNVVPVAGATVASTFTIQATITDNVKVKGASVRLVNTATGTASTFSLTLTTNNVWAVTVTASTTLTLQMTITATDTSSRTTTSPAVTFTVSTSTGGGGSGGGTGGGNTTISSAQWTTRTAPISRAAGRIMFDMPDSRGVWATYVCSGTLVQLPSGVSTVDRTIVMTAAHCIYEDVVKAFARNAMFIPQQDDGGTDISDRDCTNDALGCIALDYGFVSDEWTSRTFPNNIGVDYGFYVSRSLVTNVKGKTIGVGGDIVPMVANFGPVTLGNWSYAMGYSYNNDPKFMYSYEKISTISGGLATNYWLSSSGLSGGASGGPWTQNDPYSSTATSIPIIATNSWGYTSGPGMASSPCNTGGAACVYNAAVSTDLSTITGTGKVVSCNI